MTGVQGLHDPPFLAAALDALPESVLVVNGAGRVVFANAHTERMFGRPTSDLLEGPVEDLVVLESRALVREELAAHATGSRVPQASACHKSFGVRKGGVPFPIELVVTPMTGPDGALAVVTMRDVTDRALAEERQVAAAREAVEARDRLEVLLEFAPAFIIAISSQGTIDFINRTLPQHSKKDVIGGSWLQYFPPERQVVMQASLRAVWDTGSTQTFETTTPGADGEARWFESHMAPIRVGGQIVGAVLVSQDVTERKRAQAELVAGRHMALLGTLAAGVAHEINTPIQFVGDSVQFLRDAAGDLLALLDKLQDLRRAAVAGTPLDDVIRAAAEAEAEADLPYIRENLPSAFDRCVDGLNRVTTIVHSLKDFAHPADKEMAAVDLNRAIQSTLTIATNEYKYVATLETDLGELPPVTCHLSEINQAVLNIVVNAAHAVADATKGSNRKGVIAVRTWREGNAVVIAVRDTGGGVPEKIRARIFDPFFTTKEVGKGTGQGLAIAWSTITEHHGGVISFETEMGQGTTFFIRLPIDGKAPPP